VTTGRCYDAFVFVPVLRTSRVTPSRRSAGKRPAPAVADTAGTRWASSNSAPLPWWYAGVVAIACILAYSNSLSGPFILDDHAAIADNPQIREWWNLPRVFSPAPDSSVAGRPLVNASLAINYAIGGLDVRGYHLWNIAVHLLCALAAFGAVRRLLELPGMPPRLQDRAASIGLATALIWAVHPLNTETVNYVVQRTESMMALCYLLTIYCSVRALSALRPRRWQAAAVAACAFGMACKESMATAPLMVAAVDGLLVFGSLRRAVAARWRFYAALAATWAVLAFLNASGPRATVVGFSSGIDPWTYLLNQTVVIVHYLRLAVWPRSLVVFYGWPLPLTLADVLPHAGFLLLLAGLIIAAWTRGSKLAFLGIWFFVTLAPSSSIVPISTEVGAERRMYLPLLAIVLLVVLTLLRLHHRLASRGEPGDRAVVGWLPPAALATAALLLLAATHARNREYSSSLLLARTTVERRPTSIAHHVLGAELMDAGLPDEAIAHLRQAAPGDSRARFDLGLALFNQGRSDEAIVELRQFLATSGLPYRLVPRWLEPPFNEVVTARNVLARALAARGRLPEAIEQAELVLKIAPAHAEARRFLGGALTNLGVAHVRVDRLDDAVATFRRAAAVEPQNADAQRNLANALVDTGQGAEAEIHARRAVELAPGEPGALGVLGRALALQGRHDEARAQFERALALDPDYSDARAALQSLNP
jgi:tetratricopeptide (TPR) repeat protein